jgi:DNA-binding MarR family transcriptional regulator
MPLLEPSDLEPSESALSSAETLNLVLLRMARALIFRMDEQTPLVDLPISQIRCLNAISHVEGRKMKEIALLLHVQMPALSQIVDRLVKRGLVERRDDPEDRRVIRLHLTDTARQLIADERALRLNHVRDAIARLDDATVQRLILDVAALAKAGEQAAPPRTQKSLRRSASGSSLTSHDPVMEMLAQRARKPRRKASGTETGTQE